MWGSFIATCRALRRVSQFGGLVACATLLLAHAALADPPDPKTWAGIGWGLGIAADFHLGGKVVTDAELVNGNTILRVKDTSRDVGVGFVLEAHYFLNPNSFLVPLPGPGYCRNAVDKSVCTEFGLGPFVAIEIGGGSKATTDAGPITGYALGLMLGMHHPSASTTSSWNFGVGFRVDPHSQVLGDGFAPNQPPPAGETAVRWKYEPRYGIMLLSSFSF